MESFCNGRLVGTVHFHIDPMFSAESSGKRQDTGFSFQVKISGVIIQGTDPYLSPENTYIAAFVRRIVNDPQAVLQQRTGAVFHIEAAAILCGIPSKCGFIDPQASIALINGAAAEGFVSGDASVLKQGIPPVQINAAALGIRFVVSNPAAVQDKGSTAVYMDSAAVGCFITGNLTAGHLEPSAMYHYTAAGRRLIAGDRSGGLPEGAVVTDIHTAALQ